MAYSSQQTASILNPRRTQHPKIHYRADSMLKGLRDRQTFFLEDGLHAAVKINSYRISVEMNILSESIKPNPPKAIAVNLAGLKNEQDLRQRIKRAADEQFSRQAILESVTVLKELHEREFENDSRR